MTNVLTDFLQEGLAASRPATPSLPAGTIGFYYATDTFALSMWDPNSSTWVSVPSVQPSIVQSKSNVGASISGATMGSAPTNGNLLVAVIMGNNLDVPASGWTEFAADFTSGPTLDVHFAIFYKFAGAGESTTQTPLNSAQNCGISIYEIANTGAPSHWNNNDNQSGTATTTAVKTTSARGILIGAVLNANATTAPTSFTNATGDTGVTGGSRSMQGFHNTSPASGTNTITANWGSSQTGIYMASVWLI